MTHGLQADVQGRTRPTYLRNNVERSTCCLERACRPVRAWPILAMYLFWAALSKPRPNWPFKWFFFHTFVARSNWWAERSPYARIPMWPIHNLIGQQPHTRNGLMHGCQPVSRLIHIVIGDCQQVERPYNCQLYRKHHFTLLSLIYIRPIGLHRRGPSVGSLHLQNVVLPLLSLLLYFMLLVGLYSDAG